MKKILFVAVSSLLLFACKKDVANTNNSNGSISVIPSSSVPQEVLNAFNSSFSSASETEWEHNSSDDSFICQFNMDDQRHEARFDDHGHQSSHNVICLDAAVPAAVLDAFRTNFPTDIVYEWKLNTDGTWKAHFLRNGVKWEVTFTAEGTQIKVEHD